MSLHVIIGYPLPACKGQPFHVFCGPKYSDAQTAKDAAGHAASFMEFRNAEGLRKNNPKFDPQAKGPVAKAEGAPGVVTAPVVVLSDEEMKEIKGLKKDELITHLTAAVAEIHRLQARVDELSKPAVVQEVQEPGPDGGAAGADGSDSDESPQTPETEEQAKE